MSTETDSTPPPAYTPGPFKETRTRTFEIQGPIKFVITDHTDASHVPPIEKPCGCGGHGGDDLLIAKIGSLLNDNLSTIVAAVRAYGSNVTKED